MKRIIIACLTVIAALSAQAQSDSNLFNHMSIGINAGTPGVGVDIAVPCTDYFQIRAGVSIIPDIKASTSLEISDDVQQAVKAYAALAPQFQGYDLNVPKEVDVEGKLAMTTGKVLLDIYPIKKYSFHLTAGAYFGGADMASVYNKTSLKCITDANEVIDSYNSTMNGHEKKIGVELGDYFLTTDKNGNVNASITTKNVKPYVGIGFGRAVPKKRVGIMFEAGTMLWGTPEVTCNGQALTAQDLGSNGGDVIKAISKITFYPVINLRICGRLF